MSTIECCKLVQRTGLHKVALTVIRSHSLNSKPVALLMTKCAPLGGCRCMLSGPIAWHLRHEPGGHECWTVPSQAACDLAGPVPYALFTTDFYGKDLRSFGSLMESTRFVVHLERIRLSCPHSTANVQRKSCVISPETKNATSYA